MKNFFDDVKTEDLKSMLSLPFREETKNQLMQKLAERDQEQAPAKDSSLGESPISDKTHQQLNEVLGKMNFGRDSYQSDAPTEDQPKKDEGSFLPEGFHSDLLKVLKQSKPAEEADTEDTLGAKNRETLKKFIESNYGKDPKNAEIPKDLGTSSAVEMAKNKGGGARSLASVDATPTPQESGRDPNMQGIDPGKLGAMKFYTDQMGMTSPTDYPSSQPVDPGPFPAPQSNTPAAAYDPAQQSVFDAYKAPQPPLDSPIPQSNAPTPDPSAFDPSKQSVFDAYPAPQAEAPPINPEMAPTDSLASDIKAREKPAPDSIGNAFANAKAGLRNTGKVENTQAQALGDYTHDKAQELQRADAIDKVKQMNREDDLRNQLSQLDQSRKEMADAKIDPHRFWESRTTGQKVTLGVALFLGALGAGNGKGNLAVGVITDAIDRDLWAQKQNMGQANDKFKNQATVFGKMLDLFGNERQADAAARLHMIDRVKMEIGAQATKLGGPLAQAKAQSAAKMLDIEEQKLRLEFAKAGQAFGMVQGMPPDVQKILRAPKELHERAFKEMQSEADKNASVKEGVNAIETMYQNTGLASFPYNPLSNKDENYRTAKTVIGGKTREFFGGTMNEGELKLMIQGFTPTRNDSPESVQIKKQMFEDAIRGRNVPIILKALGIHKDINLNPAVK